MYSRLYALVYILVFLAGYALPAAGTLIVAIPTKDGLVVAADSRATAEGEYFDGREKLNLVESTPPVLFTITGSADFIDSPPPGVTLREWITKAPGFRGSSVVRAYLQQNPVRRLTLDRIAQVAAALAASLQDYFHQASIVGFRGRELCRLAMFQADEGIPRYASLAVAVTEDGRVEARGPIILKAYEPASAMGGELIGEGDYAKAHVLRGEGRRFLPERAVAILNAKLRVRDVSAADGAFLARSIIEATEATTTMIPVPSGYGIGGPVHIYLVAPQSIKRLEPAR